ncbi:putative disease resistance RPP13-like protein 1 [Phragmites australis]|uniref:putative disease resistance RPP13-like protein 1 n=1 Tax=Phragmites australis TaxID=29695 RepID=UPI002D795C63|nr:putative disease resistance RPP13-like protein 1 [Phragmites australis]
MAEVLAGWMVSPVIKIVVDKANACVSDRIKWLNDGVPKALKRLETLLVQLRAVVGAVQQRSSTASSTDLRAWLEQLMDAVYEAQDVLDHFDDSAPQPDSSIARVSKRILGTDERVNRLKGVVKKLEEVLAGSRTLLAAAETIALASGSGELSGHHRPLGRASGPMCLNEDAVFGRDEVLLQMVSWLVGTSDADAQSVSVPVAAIRGHGGMGKTTLAQLLFKDHTVASTFDLKIWVQPAPTDNELELARQILQSANVEVPDGMRSFHWLQSKLQEKVSSRKFLLVIDDVWNREDMKEHDYREMWFKVLAPLNNGKTTGSKIVVTTRQKIVATSLCAIKEVCLGGLLPDDIWSLFKRCAFGDEDVDKQPAELRDIGWKIAAKLSGSPLAAKAVGQMLEGSRSVTKWRRVLDMNMFDNVSSTLELCYQNLPEHLQPCFAICSIFPKNWRFKRDKLVKIWMALGFIQAPAGEQVEDVGSKHFDQLVARSFFHRQKAGRRRYYYIHDLMHDLAQKVSRFECIRVEGNEKEIPKTIRHLSVFGDAVAQLKSRCDLKRLRTLLILKNPSSNLNQLSDDLFTELEGLRVLGLEGCNITSLSKRIDQLKYLRYLALCKSITKLPQTVTELYRLQTISSPKGSGLEVPKDIINLKLLRHLDMDTSKIAGIGKLIHLQGSIEFNVKKEKGHTLEDLNGMSSLRKELHIKNLDVVTSRQEACEAGLNKKDNVKALELEWNSTEKSMPSVDAEVLDGLEPHQHIKKLLIRRYRGNRSPNWLNVSLKDGDFYLKYLYLINCRKWEVLPPLGQLPCLKVLRFKEMCSVKKISHEFYGRNSIAFPYLEELEFDDMPQWAEWTQEEKNIDAFPKLCKLKILNCPKLIKMPPLPLSVRTVSVKNTGLVSQLKLSSSSKACRFALDRCSTTILTDGFLHQQQVEAIDVLTLRHCQDAKFEELQALTSLRRLHISHSHINDEQLGTCLRGLQALISLEISDCTNITSLPQIESPGGCLTKLHELNIRRCSEFSYLHSLTSFVALESMLIENCPKVTVGSFPTSFNSVRSLTKLSIMYCAELGSLPSGFPSSLQVLQLIGCKPTLMNQLQLKGGPEWDKIACIPIKRIP